mmetsp:Transcript_19462/g.33416  ORF Transcript_19462/g.33416 Transcript_19462/m.33416 type:complete len:455 (-) Transcript_19462:327-1691(-)
MPTSGALVQWRPPIGILGIQQMFHLLNNRFELHRIPILRGPMGGSASCGELFLRRSLPRGGNVPSLLSIGMSPVPPFLLDASPCNVRRQPVRHVGLVTSRFHLVFSSGGGLLRRLVSLMAEGMSRGFEVNKNVRVVSSLKGEGTPVEDRVRFVKDHIARFHGDVVGFAVVRVHLHRPRLVDILIDVQNRRAHQWHAVDVRGQNTSLGIHANAVQRTIRDFFAGPFLDGIAGGIPDFALNVHSRTAEAGVFYGDHVGWRLPMIGIRIPLGPILRLPILLILVVLPKFLDAFPHLWGGPHLFESQFRIVLHTGRLSFGHLDAVRFRDSARRVAPPAGAVVLVASFHEFIVLFLLASQILNGFAFVFGRGGIVLRVDVVGEPGVIVGDFFVMDGEGDINAVSGLAEGIDVLAGEGVGWFLVSVGMASGGGGVGVGFDGGVAGTPEAEGEGGGGRGEE